jgi:hypothetical protein
VGPWVTNAHIAIDVSGLVIQYHQESKLLYPLNINTLRKD